MAKLHSQGKMSSLLGEANRTVQHEKFEFSFVVRLGVALGWRDPLLGAVGFCAGHSDIAT